VKEGITMSRKLTRALLGALTMMMMTAGAVQAIDTWEPYPVGLRAFEAYGQRFGVGADTAAERGQRLNGGMAVGLNSSSHIYSFMGVVGDDDLIGGIDFLTMGYFQNLLDRSLDVDFWMELASFGPGLGMMSRSMGVELNFDAPRGGLFWRGAMGWENEDPEAVDDVVIGEKLGMTYGLYWQLTPVAQLLAELQTANTSGYQDLANESRMTSWALGFNRVLNETTEFILEARAQEPAEGDRTWDITAGWVVVW
jgi:hypothetical protein